MEKTITLCELDGYEFLVTEDSNAVVDFDVEERGRGYDGTGIVLNTVEFRGEDVLPRLTEVEKDNIVSKIMDGKLR